MLLTFLYHRVHTGKYSNTLKMMEENLRYLKENYPILLPGDPIPHLKTSICLTFDDAYFDFYEFVFPLLKALKIPAVLGVPVKFILDTSRPFCTWKELKEMASSGYVQIASHSYSHVDLTGKDVDLSQEIVSSKKILSEKLGLPIQTFIYPFGKFNRKVHCEVMKHYSYAMRIGNAANFSWSKLNYRICSDRLNEKDELLKKRKLPQYLFNYMINRARGK